MTPSPRRTASGALVLAVLAGCRAPAPPPEPDPGPTLPPIATRVRHFAGSPVEGVQPGRVDAPETSADVADALRVRFGLRFVETLPPELLDPLGPNLRLIASTRGDEPILATPPIAGGTRIGTGEPARELLAALDRGDHGPAVAFPRVEAALPTGVTAELTASTPKAVVVGELGPVSKRLTIALHLPRPVEGAASPLEAYLEVEDIVQPRLGFPAGEAVELGPASGLVVPSQFVVHRVLFELARAPKTDGGLLVLVIPSPFGDETGAGYVLSADVSPPPTEGPEAAAHALAVRRCRQDLASEHREAGERVATLDPISAEERRVAAALLALRAEPRNRAALVYLAATTDSAVSEDLVLTATDSDLDELVTRVRKAARVGSAERLDVDALGWTLEREALDWLAARRVAESLPPELLAVLLRHTGEVGHQAALLQDVLARSSDERSFAAALVEETLLLLDDPSPGARVRACGWLAERGLAPEGYDPMGPKAERRAALARAEREAERRDASAEPAPAAAAAGSDGGSR